MGKEESKIIDSKKLGPWIKGSRYLENWPTLEVLLKYSWSLDYPSSLSRWYY